MAPVGYVPVNVRDLPSNGSDVGFLNTTSDWQEDGSDTYDSAGAMRFIVTTLMVYSLMGITGLLLLRIRRRASPSHRVVSIREEHLQQYIKRADDLKLAGHRQKLKMDATRMVLHLQNLERQKSYIRSDSEENNAICETASLLHLGVPNGQQLRQPDSQNSCPNTPSLSCHEQLVLPHLPKESPSIQSLHLTSMPSACFSFCNNCGAPFTGSPDRRRVQFQWTKTPHSPTCDEKPAHETLTVA